MITLPTQLIITTPTQSYDSVWIRSININAGNNASGNIFANLLISPYNSTTGAISNISTNIQIPDVMNAAATNPYIANAMGSIFEYVQDQIASGSVSF